MLLPIDPAFNKLLTTTTYCLLKFWYADICYSCISHLPATNIRVCTWAFDYLGYNSIMHTNICDLILTKRFSTISSKYILTHECK